MPLVVQSSLFDLTVGDSKVRPDAAMGYEAARLALDAPNYRDGNYGAGCGATVGKYAGMDWCMKTGIGSYAVQVGRVQVGAIAVVNAMGDVYDWRQGRQIAGMLTEDKKAFRRTADYLMEAMNIVENKFVGNTTLCAVVTNALFSKAQLTKIAGMAHDGYARSISPVHTTVDGDSVYAISVGREEGDLDAVGTLAGMVTSEAITRAVTSAESAYGFPSASELGFC